MMKLTSLRSRIAIFFSLLLAVVLVIVFILVTITSYQTGRQQNRDELLVGKRVFDSLLLQNRRQLTLAASVLTADFGFLEAVTGDDLDTIISALRNHGRRVEADMMMLVSLDGKIIADSVQPEIAGQTAPVKEILREAENKGTATDIMLLRGHVYQVIVVPVLAPTHVAWVALGFILDEQAVENIQNITSLQVSFLARSGNGRWTNLVSTHSENIQGKLSEAVNRMNDLSGIIDTPVEIGSYATLISAINSDSPGDIITVLQRSTKYAAEQFAPLRTTLFVLSVISLVLTIIGSILIARRVTSPLNSLSTIAQNIRDGDYSKRAVIKGPDEINALADSFNLMSDAIASRESEIQRLAYEDKLTGLPNRTMFNEKLEQIGNISKRTGMPFSIMLLNLDRFKDINDALGHEAGDEVLNLVAKRLSKVIRESDTVACLGGDDFAILLTTGAPQRILTVVHRIQHVLREPHVVSGQPIDISMSIGIANAPEHSADAGILLRQADIALNVAKRNQSDYVIYTPDYEENRQKHLNLLSELRRAVDNDQLELYYQPKLDLNTNRITSVEALIRWQHPERGLISPAEFIPFAEQTGAIRMVTGWVIKTVSQQCRSWNSRGISITVSLNISTRDLLNREFVQLLNSEITENGISPEMLCLEITESALMEDPGFALSTVMSLHETGFSLAIDDYGTGYSSLSYIKDLPVNEIKIDRVFIMNMSSHNQDSAIVRSTIDLGHNLGLIVTAEGIETASQLTLLSDYGCNLGQGFYIARPLSVSSLEKFLSEQQ